MKFAVVETQWSLFLAWRRSEVTLLSFFLSLVLIVCQCPPFVPLCHFCPFPLMKVDFAQGLLDDGRRASTIAMGLNKQDKDHLVVRQIPKRFTNTWIMS